MAHDGALHSVLHRLPSIDVDELTAAAELLTRRDRKYLVPVAAVPDFVSMFSERVQVLHIEGDRVLGYRSLYFDSPDHDSYMAAARGRPRRYKVRTRIYDKTGECNLELKARERTGLTVKHRQPHDLASHRDLTARGRQFVTDASGGRLSVDGWQPKLSVAYQRTTLLDAESSARITVDTNVVWTLDDGRSTSTPGLAIIETKSPGRPTIADRSLWRGGFRPSRISKYCTGLASLVPSLPANRWTVVLKRHFAGPIPHPSS